MNGIAKKAWLILGDFNSVLTAEDRIGDECGLIQLPYQGGRYTWNDKSGDDIIFSKIDWMFINQEWLDTMPTSRTIFLPDGISDHCPDKVTLKDEIHRRQKAFQYCNAWGQHPQFQKVVKEGWDMPIMG
ncbi:hypothetical protein H5410_001211 [Solanum commersonii]|uniref:Endonuclease/exonuclease/phosphatase domain-containing protein n=1 Tax=Solanum commersonii TaxID=4109 RepID=A0A9J6AYA0_SOLCO|nr:hypothetical protein H5410_001211 [Solanum commersonii]